MASDSSADVVTEPADDEDSDDEPLELTPDEVLEINPSAEEAFSPE